MTDDDHSFQASATIAAPPAAVWKVLTDVAAWPTWDSGVESVVGTAALGGKLTIRSLVAPGRAFPVKVTAFDSPTRLEFTGGMPLGLFRGVRSYTLTPDGTGTRFVMREVYTGALLGAMWKQIPDLTPSFATFVDGLKAKVESGA